MTTATCSEIGVFDHQHDWDPTFRYWLWSRPFVGAGLSAVSVLILQAGILAVGSTPGQGSSGPPQNLLYYLAAFLVGYREETFRELIKRLTDLILGSDAAAPGALTITAVHPAQGSLVGGDEVQVIGTGFVDVMLVTFATRAAAFVLQAPSHLSATVPAGEAVGPVVVPVRTKTASTSGALFRYT